MKARLAILVVSGMGCASTSMLTTPVYPFGPDTYTTSASTSIEPPNQVREQVIADASAFCGRRGERSLPIEINLITQPTSNLVVHSVTIRFRCFDPDRLRELEDPI